MKKVLAVAVVSFLPVVAFAQRQGSGLEGAVSGLPAVINQLTKSVNALIPFFLAIAVVVFIWGIIKFIMSASAEGKSEGRGIIIWGVVSIAVIVSLFGLVRLLQNTFGINNPATIDYPQI